MKYISTGIVFLLCSFGLYAQSYPEPEFTNEVCYLKKDSATTVVRLEKETSKMESKTKGAGFGGYENGYMLDGERSSVRLRGTGLSFVFSSGASSGLSSSTAQRDSMLRANGVNPSDMNGMMGGTGDPTSSISLYKADVSKGKRKILMQKIGGAFSGKKLQSSDKYTFSVKKIRDGYWELIIDKKLPQGEYAFTTMSYNTGAMDGSITLYTFGVD